MCLDCLQHFRLDLKLLCKASIRFSNAVLIEVLSLVYPEKKSALVYMTTYVVPTYFIILMSPSKCYVSFYTLCGLSKFEKA